MTSIRIRPSKTITKLIRLAGGDIDVVRRAICASAAEHSFARLDDVVRRILAARTRAAA